MVQTSLKAGLANEAIAKTKKLGLVETLHPKRTNYSAKDARNTLKKEFPDDPGFVELLLCYVQICNETNMCDKVAHAVRGAQTMELEQVIRRHMGKVKSADFSPPHLVNRDVNLIECSNPGKEFIIMGRELIQTMQVLIIACDDRNVAAIRWNWRHELLHQLGMLECNEIAKVLLAHTCCVILSCATEDGSCIKGTVNLKNAGLMSIDALANASLEDVQAAIRIAGTHKTRAEQLISMAKCVRDNHGGVTPCDCNVLVKLQGFGRKTCLLLTTEVFGLLNGIPTDKHVVEAVLAHKLVKLRRGDPRLNPDRAEASLREWIPHRHFSSINRVLGSFAQMFTQDLTTPASVLADGRGLTVMRAMLDYLHKPHHLELIWCAMRTIRLHCRGKKHA